MKPCSLCDFKKWSSHRSQDQPWVLQHVQDREAVRMPKMPFWIQSDTKHVSVSRCPCFSRQLPPSPNKSSTSCVQRLSVSASAASGCLHAYPLCSGLGQACLRVRGAAFRGETSSRQGGGMWRKRKTGHEREVLGRGPRWGGEKVSESALSDGTGVN